MATKRTYFCENCFDPISKKSAECPNCRYSTNNKWGLGPIDLKVGYIRYIKECIFDDGFDVRELGEYITFCYCEMENPQWSGQYHIDGLDVVQNKIVIEIPYE